LKKEGDSYKITRQESKKAPPVLPTGGAIFISCLAKFLNEFTTFSQELILELAVSHNKPFSFLLQSAPKKQTSQMYITPFTEIASGTGRIL